MKNRKASSKVVRRRLRPERVRIETPPLETLSINELVRIAGMEGGREHLENAKKRYGTIISAIEMVLADAEAKLRQ